MLTALQAWKMVIGLLALSLMVVLPSTSRAQQVSLLGQRDRSTSQAQPPGPTGPAAPAAGVQHKAVRRVTTYVQNAAGQRSSVTWEFTTRVRNAQTGQWQPLDWQTSYRQALGFLQQRGWTYTGHQLHPESLVVGTW